MSAQLLVMKTGLQGLYEVSHIQDYSSKGRKLALNFQVVRKVRNIFRAWHSLGMYFKCCNCWSASKSNLQMESRKPCPSPLGGGHPSHFPSLVGHHRSLFLAVESKVQEPWIHGDLKKAATRAPAIHSSSGLNPEVEENNSRQTTLVFRKILLGLPISNFRKLNALLKSKKKVFSVNKREPF